MHVFFLLLLSHIAPGTGDFHQPQLAAKGKQTTVAFGSNESIYVSSSKDDGVSFTSPVMVAHVPGLNLGMHRGPRIVFSGDNIVVTAINGKTDGDLLAWRSSDQGKSWTGPVHVNDTPKAAREGLHAMVALPSGRVFTAWLDLRHVVPGKPGTELYGAYSDDAGKTWSKNVAVFRSPSGTICQCCHPSLTVDAKGGMHVMWRNVMDESRDLYTAASSDGGTTWGKATKLGNGTWKLNACPMDGGGIAVTPAGDLVSVWRRESSLFLALPNQPEKLLGEGKNPALAIGHDGTYTIWQTPKGIEAFAPGTQAPVMLDADGTFPQLIALPSGHVLAAWERKGTLQFHTF